MTYSIRIKYEDNIHVYSDVVFDDHATALLWNKLAEKLTSEAFTHEGKLYAYIEFTVLSVRPS